MDWATGNGPIATGTCRSSTSYSLTFPDRIEHQSSQLVECPDPTVDEFVYSRWQYNDACDGSPTSEIPWSYGAYCSDDSRSCSLIEFAIYSYQDDNFCQGDWRGRFVYVLTDGGLNDGKCNAVVFDGDGSTHHSYMYTYDEINGLRIDHWRDTDLCDNTIYRTSEFRPGCESYGLSSQFVSFLNVVPTHEPTEEPTEQPDDPDTGGDGGTTDDF